MAADALAGETESAEFGILGPLEVWRSGCVVPLGGPRQRAVLEAGRYAEAAGSLRQALGLWRSGVLADLADYAFTRRRRPGWRSCGWPRPRPGSTRTWCWAGTMRWPPSWSSWPPPIRCGSGCTAS